MVNIIMNTDNIILGQDMPETQEPTAHLPQSNNLDKEDRDRDKRHKWTKMSAIVVKN